MKEIGHTLKRTRESRGFTVKDVARQLKMRSYYIDILESGEMASVSKDIYLVGYLKSYATWLGLNSAEMVARYKVENGDATVAKKMTADSATFFNWEENLLKPGRIALVATIIVIGIYYGWYHTIGKQSHTEILPNLEVNDSEFQKYRGFSYKKGEYQKLVIVAREKAELTLWYSETHVVTQKLGEGDAYFLADDADVLIRSDRPKMIDVFFDDKENTFFGTLEDLYIKN